MGRVHPARNFDGIYEENQPYDQIHIHLLQTVSFLDIVRKDKTLQKIHWSYDATSVPLLPPTQL